MTLSTSREEMEKFAKHILSQVSIPGFTGKTQELWQIGMTKVFLKESQVRSRMSSPVPAQHALCTRGPSDSPF
jgi:hypothetical protein